MTSSAATPSSTVEPTVVEIGQGFDEAKVTRRGSGVLIAAHRVLTCEHVLRRGKDFTDRIADDEVWVRFAGRSRWVRAGPIARPKELDWLDDAAVITVDSGDRSPIALLAPFSRADRIPLPTISYGFPGSDPQAVLRGVPVRPVAGMFDPSDGDRVERLVGDNEVIQGMSGGPLVAFFEGGPVLVAMNQLGGIGSDTACLSTMYGLRGRVGGPGGDGPVPGIVWRHLGQLADDTEWAVQELARVFDAQASDAVSRFLKRRYARHEATAVDLAKLVLAESRRDVQGLATAIAASPATAEAQWSVLQWLLPVSLRWTIDVRGQLDAFTDLAADAAMAARDRSAVKLDEDESPSHALKLPRPLQAGGGENFLALVLNECAARYGLKYRRNAKVELEGFLAARRALIDQATTSPGSRQFRSVYVAAEPGEFSDEARDTLRSIAGLELVTYGVSRDDTAAVRAEAMLEATVRDVLQRLNRERIRR